MLLLERNTTRKGRVDENATELDAGDNNSGEYEVEAILGQRCLCKKVRIRSSTRALLSGFLKRLSKRRKYLEALFSGPTR